MAEEKSSKPKRRVVKQAATMREQVEKHRNAQVKNRGVVGQTLYYISWPFRMIGRGIAKVGRFVVPKYFKESYAELKQVTWPNWNTTWKLTLAVIIFSILFGAFITIIDIGLDKVFRKVILD